MQIEARAPVARVRIGIHSVSGGEAAGAVALAHHWPAAILAERRGSWCWRAHRTDSDSSKLRGPSLSSRQSSEPRDGHGDGVRTCRCGWTAAEPCCCQSGLRGHVSIRRHWLSDTCTHTNTHKGRRRDESTSQRRSPDRGLGCDAPYTPLLKRRGAQAPGQWEALAAEEVDAALLAGEAPASQLIDCSQPHPQHGNDRARPSDVLQGHTVQLRLLQITAV